MRIMILIAFACGLSACSNPIEDLKSPCVGAGNSPCEYRVPSSQWMS